MLVRMNTFSCTRDADAVEAGAAGRVAAHTISELLTGVPRRRRRAPQHSPAWRVAHAGDVHAAQEKLLGSTIVLGVATLFSLVTNPYGDVLENVLDTCALVRCACRANKLLGWVSVHL